MKTNRYTGLLTVAICSTAIILFFSCTRKSFEEVNPSQNTAKAGSILKEESSGNSIRVLSFNILAPCWADPAYYPVSSAPYLNRIARRKSIIDLLTSYQNSVDVFALQEVAQVEFNFIRDALKMTHIGFQANHAPTYWANWVTPANPWELNGNAVFVNKNRFTNITFEDFPSSTSGNHSALFTGAIKNAGGKTIRLASVHLDSDYPYNRKNELGAVLSKWIFRANTVDLIAGDFNTETDATNIQTDIKKAGYYDLLEVLGTSRQTHPWDTKYYGADNWGIIDHIISRNSNAVNGNVIDFELFRLFPGEEDTRINLNLQKSGSDHFPLIGAVAY